MYRVTATVRICAALVSLTICALMLADLLGLLPDRAGAVAEGRVALTESVAVSCSLASQQQDLGEIESILAALVERNATVLSAGFRLSNGNLVIAISDHQQRWVVDKPVGGAQQLQVPLAVNGTIWGHVEICFSPAEATALGIISRSSLVLVIFVALASFASFFWYLRRVLRHLDPSRVIPDRVRTTLNTLAEGLLVVDREQRIAMANSTFSQIIGHAADDLLGKEATALPWVLPDAEHHVFPWTRSIDTGSIQTDCRLRVRCESGVERVFKVNSAPIFADDGTNRGALATFSDVTELELRNSQLHDTLTKLERSREQIRQHNEQLKTLATRDPLTGCLNRRAFFEEAEKAIRTAEIKGYTAGYIIFDIDHFKSINDNHGHAVGDDVLKAVGKLVQAKFGDAGVVCRYGGEEFSVLLPQLTCDQVAHVADRFRVTLEASPVANLKVTASIGVAQLERLSSNGLREAMERADKALYVAKRSGRNQVRRWDQIQPDQARAPQKAGPPKDTSPQIPFSAVSALSAALYYRDAATAEHSRRVATLVAAAGRGMMSEENRYVLEVAALLHDIGKLGVPDAVLHKPGALTAEEWRIMKTYQQVGTVILENAFSHPQLVQIVRTYRADFSGTPDHAELPRGKDIPIAARLLKIADAYDSMTHRKTYRDSLDQQAAFGELRKWAGTQFDSQLTEHFIQTVENLNLDDRLALNVNRRTALQLGLETEKLTCALDAQDRVTLKEMAIRLRQVAERNGLQEILQLTEKVEELVSADAEWLYVLGSAVELLDTCRLAQWACVADEQGANTATTGLVPAGL